MGRVGSWRCAKPFAHALGVLQLLLHQEPVGCDAQAGVVMESAPASAFVVSQPYFLLEVLVVALDALAHLGFKHDALQRHVLSQRGQPIFHRFLLAFGPLDDKPFFGAQLRAPVPAMGGAQTNPDNARAQREIAAFALLGAVPLRGRQLERQFLDRLRAVLL